MFLKRALALTLILAIVGAAPGLTPYAALAAESTMPESARPVVEGAAAPGSAGASLPVLPVPASGLPSQTAVPAEGAASPEAGGGQGEAAAAGAPALSEQSPVFVAPAVGAALEQAAPSPAETTPAASGPAAWLGRVFDGLRRRKSAALVEPGTATTPQSASGASAGSLALSPSAAPAAPADAAAEPPAPKTSAFSGVGAYAARNVTWWLRPTTALVGALWLQKAAAAEGLAGSLHAAAGLSPAALWSTLIVASLTAVLYAAPRAALQALRRLSPVPTGVEKAQTAAAFAVGALAATALQAPFGWGIPSMLLMGGSIAAILAWAASIRRLAPAPERAANTLERSAGLVGFAVAAAVPAALALDIFGWLPFSAAWLLTTIPAAVLFLDMILAAPVRLYRAVVPAPTDPQRRGVLSGLSATGLASLAVGGGLSVAASLGPDFDHKLGHFHADEGSSYHSWDERADDAVAPLPSWEDLRAAAERLKKPLEPDAAVAEARAISLALGPYVDEKSDPEYQAWLRNPSTTYEYWNTHPRPKKRPLSEAQRLWLIDFVLDPQVVHSPSAAARELILDAKRKAIDALIDRESPEPNLASREALKALWSYSERIDRPDPTYPRFGFTEEERLTLGVKAHYYDVLPHYQTKEGDTMSRRYRDISEMLRKWLTRDTLAAEMDQQRAMDKERAAPLHSLPLSRVKRARDYRAWPKDVLAAVSEAARAHGIPEELLIVNLGTQIERQYTLREGFDVWAQRQDEKTSSGRLKVKIAKWLSDKMPAGVAMPVRWNDFLGGMILNGKNGIGLYQIRPANVRRYPWVWKRFGVPDANALSDREITWRLHDPRYNAEAWACILEGMAQDVDNLRLKASRGEKLDFSTYEKESKNWLTPSDDKVYALLPTLDSVPGRWWRLTAFHPLLRDKAGMDIGDAGTLLASGALDGRPATLTNIRSLDDVKDAAKLLTGDDTFFAGAARRGLTAVAAGAAKPEVAKAASEALAKAPKKTASLGLPSAAGLAFAAAGALTANPTVSRRGLLGIGATGSSKKDAPKK